MVVRVLRIEQRAILSNIAFTPEDQLQFTVRAEELTQTTPSDKGTLCFASTTAEWSYGRILLRGSGSIMPRSSSGRRRWMR